MKPVLHVLLLFLIVFEPSEAENIQDYASEVVEGAEEALNGNNSGGVNSDGSEYDTFVLFLHKYFIDDDEHKAEDGVGGYPFPKEVQFALIVVLLAKGGFQHGRFVLLYSLCAPCHIIHIAECIDYECVGVGSLVVQVRQECAWVQHLHYSSRVCEQVKKYWHNQTSEIYKCQVFYDLSCDSSRRWYTLVQKVVKNQINHHDCNKEDVIQA